jgi:hypothetical protein
VAVVSIDEAACTSFVKLAATTWASLVSPSRLDTLDWSEKTVMSPDARAPMMSGMIVTTMSSSISVNPRSLPLRVRREGT